jgi:hypothetical protein
MSTNRVELPGTVEPAPENKHISLVLIADGLAQAEVNIEEQEGNIRKLSEQLTQLQNMRIASIAQRNLLINLRDKIVELEKA